MELEIIDLETGQVRHMELESNGDVWDWQRGRLYDVDMVKDGSSGSVYDYSTGKYYYFER